MTEPVFFRRGPGLTIADIARIAGAKPDSTVNPAARIHNVAPIERAGPSDLTLFDKAGNENGARATQAGACLVTAGLAKLLPPGTARLTVDDPCVAFAAVTAALFPQASRPSSLFEVQGAAASAQVHPSARVEPGVTIDPAAVIGPRAEIGGGTFIGPMVVVGPDVRIGRECSIAASASITNALIGDRVVIHPGCRIGQEGGRGAAAALGRVIIQDGVEIGANCAIDRGGIGDTIIGEGAKIDNLVHIAHDVSVGRHCAVAAQSGLPDALMLDDHSRWPRDGRDGRAK